MFRKTLAASCVAVVLPLLAIPARADVILLKNGDHLTGTIDSMVGGKLSVKDVPGLGEVKIDAGQIDSFSTDKPVVIRFQDQTTITQKVDLQRVGGMVTIDGGVLGKQLVPTSDIAEINPPSVAWTGEIKAGGLFARGNSQTDSLNLGASLSRKSETDQISLSGTYIYGRTTDRFTHVSSTTAENWTTEARYDYFFDKKFYGFLDAQVSKDRIAELDLRFVPSIGLGYKWVDRPEWTFYTEGGVAWVYERYTNATPTREDVSLRFAYHFTHKFSDHVSLFHDLQYVPSVQNGRNFFVTTDLGLRANLTKHLFTEGKIILDYDSAPASGALKTNTTWIINLGYTL